jgi:hypothetical protein
MSRVRLACICVAVTYGVAALTVGSPQFLRTAMAKGGHGGGHHGAHKGGHGGHGGHRGGHHHAARPGARGGRHAFAHHHRATGHRAPGRRGFGRRHYAVHRHPHRYYGHRYAGWHRYYNYGGTYNSTSTVVGVPTVVPDPVVGGPVIAAPLVAGPRIRLGYRAVLGTISVINGNALTIVRGDGEPTTVSVTSGTTIILNGAQAAMVDLRQTDRAKVTYDAAGNAVSLVVLRG